MVGAVGKVVLTIVVVVIGRWGWKLLDWAWFRPKKLEKLLREQGFDGNSYKLLVGDMKEMISMAKEARFESIPLSHDIYSHALPLDHHTITKYGKKSFIWFGPNPRAYIMDPELIKEILSKPNDFPKPHPEPFRDSIIKGLVVYEGEKWVKHRKIINPAFHVDKLKNMFSAIYTSCSEMIEKWELSMAESGSDEVDVWPYIDNLAGDVISRTAFGSCYEEGLKIFQIQKEQVDLLLQIFVLLSVPGGRFLPTRANKKFKKNKNELRGLLRGIISQREKEIEMGQGNNDDLLGILLESNSKEIKEEGIGMSMEDVMEECNLFYVAGSDTTSNLIVWTMVCLSMHQDWQIQAREEVLQVFGTREPDFDGLKHLKIVTTILHEVLRLYPPVIMATRATTKETKLGNMTLPAGVQLGLPIMHIHHDREIWGEDAAEFKPERFSEGVLNATKGKGSYSYFPFTGGPRVCIGQNFAMTEAKTAIAMILQRFSFVLSPSYKHSPFVIFTMPPQFGAHLILSKV